MQGGQRWAEVSKHMPVYVFTPSADACVCGIDGARNHGQKKIPKNQTGRVFADTVPMYLLTVPHPRPLPKGEGSNPNFQIGRVFFPPYLKIRQNQENCE